MQNELDQNFYHILIAALAVSSRVQNRLEMRIAEALRNPRDLYDEDGDFLLSERGLTFEKHRHLTAKFVLIDTMIDEGQMTEIDWKADETEIRGAMNRILQTKDYGFELSPTPRYENAHTSDALHLIDEDELLPNSLSLQLLDIESDSYVFTIVPVEQQHTVEAMFAALK